MTQISLLVISCIISQILLMQVVPIDGHRSIFNPHIFSQMLRGINKINYNFQELLKVLKKLTAANHINTKGLLEPGSLQVKKLPLQQRDTLQIQMEDIEGARALSLDKSDTLNNDSDSPEDRNNDEEDNDSSSDSNENINSNTNINMNTNIDRNRKIHRQFIND